MCYRLKDDISKLIQKKAAAEEEENLEEHRFDANQVHSRLNLTNDFGNDIDVDIDVDNMDNINVDNSMLSIMSLNLGLFLN